MKEKFSFEANITSDTPAANAETQTARGRAPQENTPAEEQEYTIVDHLEKQNEEFDGKKSSDSEQEYSIVDHLEKQNEGLEGSPEKQEESIEVKQSVPEEAQPSSAVAQERETAAKQENTSAIDRLQEEEQLKKLTEAALIQNGRLNRLEKKLAETEDAAEKAKIQEKIADTEKRYQMLQDNAQAIRQELYPSREPSGAEIDKAKQAYAEKQMMRLYEQPGFMEYLSGQDRQIDPTTAEGQAETWEKYTEFMQAKEDLLKSAFELALNKRKPENDAEQKILTDLLTIHKITADMINKRMLDAVARELGLIPEELRKKESATERVDRLQKKQQDLVRAVTLLQKVSGVKGMFKKMLFRGLKKEEKQEIDRIGRRHRVKTDLKNMMKALEITNAQLSMARAAATAEISESVLRRLNNTEEESERAEPAPERAAA